MKNIQEDIKTGNFKQAYLLYGEEAYLKQQYKHKLVQALNPEDDTMNFNHYEGRNIDVKELIDLCETMPFFADREISDRMGSIFGTKGYIQVQNINNPEKITVFDKEHKEVAAYLPPAQITGDEYEVEACARAIAQGEKECPEMPHDETVRVMEIMDGIRKSWGYEIPLYE